MVRLFSILGLLAGAALGSTITYTFTATASGNFEGNPFTNALFTITAIADSSLPTEPSSATFSVGSFSDTVNNQSPSVFNFQGNCPGPESPAVTSCAAFQDTHGSVLFIQNNAFATYTLGTTIGPIDDATPFLTTSTIADHGTITFSSATNGTFQAVGSASAPESATLTLLSIGLTGIFLIRRGHSCGVKITN
jgi:hypothetical protein